MAEIIVYGSDEEIIKKAKMGIGRTFSSLDVNNRLAIRSNKGDLGQIVEEGLFGYRINGRQEPDFAEAGTELKVTGYKTVKQGKSERVVAKERLVLTMIDFYDVPKFSFYESHCYAKMKKILLMWYHYIEGKYKGDYYTEWVILYKFNLIPEEDKAIIEHDYETIRAKIKRGEAHLLSESDTDYLAANRKGNKDSKPRRQPYSDELAKSRSFSLKPKYMTMLINSSWFVNNVITKDTLTAEKEVSGFTADEVRGKGLSNAIVERMRPYLSMSLSAIDGKLGKGITRSSYDYLYRYVRAMLNTQCDPEDLDEFRKAGIKVKTVRLDANGTPEEDTSLPAFRFADLAREEDWFESSLRDRLTSEKYLFCVFTPVDRQKKEYVFSNAFVWGVPDSDLDGDIREVWEITRSLAVTPNGIRIETKPLKTGGVSHPNNLPKSSWGKCMHVRPHTSRSAYRLFTDADDDEESLRRFADLIPDGTGRMMTRQCFFFNKKYIKHVIEEHDLR